MSKVKVQLHSKGVAALLKSESVGAYIERIAQGRAGGKRVSRIVGKSRQNVRIHGSLDDDAKTGGLTKSLGG